MPVSIPVSMPVLIPAFIPSLLCSSPYSFNNHYVFQLSSILSQSLVQDSVLTKRKRNALYLLVLVTHYDEGLQSSEVFAFDPNTASQSDFQRLGLESWQARNIIKYRNKGGIFRTPRDFARVYGLTKKQFEKLLPFIRIGKDYQPAANFYPRERYNYGYQETAIRTREERKKDTTQYSYPRKLKEGQYININSADTTELQKIPGIGSYYARSIIRYRERLGGFVSMSQIQEVEGVPETALHYMNIDAKHIRKMNVNQLSLAELRKHPYLDFYQAKEIVNYRRTHGPLKSAEELRLLKDFPPAEIERIKPYLAY